MKALRFVTELPGKKRDDYESHKKWTQDNKLGWLKDIVKENIGLIFTEEPYYELKPKIESLKIYMQVKTNAIAQSDVIIPAGNT